MIRPLPLATSLALLGGAAHAAYTIEHVTVIDGTGAAAEAALASYHCDGLTTMVDVRIWRPRSALLGRLGPGPRPGG